MKRASIAAVCLSLLLSMSSFGQQAHSCTGPQLGTWKLQSVTTRYLDTGVTSESYGAHPVGYLSYGPDCRMYAIIAQENRKPPAGVVPTDAEKIELFGGFIAYAGTYTIDGDRVSHHVDVSWIEAWTGTTQVRQFKIADKVLHIQSIPAKNPRDGRLSSSLLVWTKVE
jgi:hypothetical protein